MIEYVCGFMFSPDGRDVALIRKDRGHPNLIGKFNGIGGKIEDGEGPYEAMVREFEEEAGVTTRKSDWTQKVTYESGEFRIYFMVAHSTQVYEVRTMESETIHILDTGSFRVIPKYYPDNMQWILSLILDPKVTKAIILR